MYLAATHRITLSEHLFLFFLLYRIFKAQHYAVVLSDFLYRTFGTFVLLLSCLSDICIATLRCGAFGYFYRNTSLWCFRIFSLSHKLAVRHREQNMVALVFFTSTHRLEAPQSFQRTHFFKGFKNSFDTCTLAESTQHTHSTAECSTP